MIKLVIPEIPPLLNELNRMHHQARGRMKKQWVEVVEWLVLEQKVKPLIPVEKSIIFYRFWFPDRRKRDITNMYGGPVKILEDGIVGAGLIVDDSIKHSILIVLPMGMDRKNPRVEIEIHPVAKLDPAMIQIEGA